MVTVKAPKGGGRRCAVRSRLGCTSMQHEYLGLRREG